MFKRDAVAISLITSEEEILFFGETSFNTSPPKKAKVDNGDVLKRMLGGTDLKASEFINRYMGNLALKIFQVPKMSEAQLRAADHQLV